MIEIYRDTYRIKSQQNNQLYNLIKQIDILVQQYADKAYNVSALDYNNPKQRNWLEKIEQYCNNGQVLLMNAYYGYSVEEMVNQELRARYNTAINGYNVELQVTHGNTRPDIVITDRRRIEVAWLDITSEKSAGHIYDKDGSGWRTKGFVAELLYESFDISKLRNSDDDGTGTRIKALSAARKASMHQRHLINHLESKLNIALFYFSQKYPESKSEVAANIGWAFDYSFTEHKKHPAIKSMLKKYLEYFPNSSNADLIKSILNDYYSNDRQDLALAMRFISKSYAQEQENQRIYFNYNDSDDLNDFLA